MALPSFATFDRRCGRMSPQRQAECERSITRDRERGAFAMSERFQILINWLALLVLVGLGIVWGVGPVPPS
jgi:hypothetical protein